jgi:hypothetical protein
MVESPRRSEFSVITRDGSVIETDAHKFVLAAFRCVLDARVCIKNLNEVLQIRIMVARLENRSGVSLATLGDLALRILALSGHQPPCYPETEDDILIDDLNDLYNFEIVKTVVSLS